MRWPAALCACLAAITGYLYDFHLDLHEVFSLRPLMIGIPCGLLIISTVALERRGLLPKWASLVLVGDVSYSLYLVHGFILGFGQRLWHRFLPLNSPYSHAAFIVFILAASIAVSIPIYRYLEVWAGRRLTAALKHLRSRNHQAEISTIDTK